MVSAGQKALQIKAGYAIFHPLLRKVFLFQQSLCIFSDVQTHRNKCIFVFLVLLPEMGRTHLGMLSHRISNIA